MDRLLSRDIVLRVLAILMALVLWVQATTERNPEDQFTLDGLTVNTENTPEGTIVVGSPRPGKVSVTVRCGRRQGEKLTAASLAIAVSLEGGRVGTHEYPAGVSLPAGVELVQITPPLVSVTLEELARSETPVEAKMVGAWPEGYRPGTWTTTPATVQVMGPASAVARVVQALARCDVSEATGTFSQSVLLIAVDSAGAAVAGVTLAPPQALVEVEVTTLPAPESVDVTPALTGLPAAGYAVLRVAANPDRVSLRPEPGRLIDFDHIFTTPIDISGLTSDLAVVVDLVVPEGIASVRPAEVEVTVTIGSSLSLIGLPVEIRHPVHGFSSRVEPSVADVTIRGPRPLLDQIEAESLTVWVDAANRGIGSFTVRVNVDLPDWLEGRAEIFTCHPEEVLLTIGP